MDKLKKDVEFEKKRKEAEELINWLMTKADELGISFNISYEYNAPQNGSLYYDNGGNWLSSNC